MLCEYGCGKEAEFVLKNKKNCCSKHPSSCSELRKRNSSSKKGKYNPPTFNQSWTIKGNCKFCNRDIATCSLKKHEDNCYLNTNNIKLCLHCNSPIKNWRYSSTCSYRCSNVFYRDKQQEERLKSNKVKRSYKTICFRNHKKECIICGEDISVDVHHFDHNRENNHPSNLVPLCRNHHQYYHSKNRSIVEPTIIEYVKKFKESVANQAVI